MSRARDNEAARLLVAGIDEAGFGPMLGPLCVAMAVLDLPASAVPEEGAPDLWALLSEGVCRTPGKAESAAGRRIAVNDSKRLKLPNNAGKRHPLMHLERGVLAFTGCVGGVEAEAPTTDTALLAALGVEPLAQPWYAGPPIALPISGTAEQLRLATVRLRRALFGAGVGVRDVRCVAVDESAFNAALDQPGGKSAVTFGSVAALLRRVWRSRAAQAGDGPPPRVVLDRQGGRRAYGPALRAALGAGVGIAAVREDALASVYNARDGSGRQMRVIVMTGAESAHLPVALASMTAKLVRELFMLRFNRYWCGRCAELKPTAGYVADARRWLADAAALGVLTPGDREALRRRA